MRVFVRACARATKCFCVPGSTVRNGTAAPLGSTGVRYLALVVRVRVDLELVKPSVDWHGVTLPPTPSEATGDRSPETDRCACVCTQLTVLG